MNKLFTIIFASAFSLFIIGCNTQKNYSALDAGINLPEPEEIESQQKAITKISEDQRSEEDIISKSTYQIQNSAENISNKIESAPEIKDAPIKEDIKKEINIITQSAKQIENSNNSLKQTTQSLNDFQSFLKSLMDNSSSVNKQVGLLLEKNKDNLALVTKLEKENTDLKSKENEQLKKNMATIIMVSVIGLGVGVALIFLGNVKAGGSVVAFSSCIGASALFIDKFQLEIAIGFGIILICILGYLAFRSWSKSRALKQSVETTEAIKPMLNEDQKKKVFGINAKGISPGTEGIVHKIQSKATSKEIDQIRKKYNFDWVKNAKFKTDQIINTKID